MSHYGNTAKDNLHRTIMDALDGFLHDTDKDSEIADMTAEDRLDFIRESIVGKDILYWLCEMSAVKAVEAYRKKAEDENAHKRESVVKIDDPKDMKIGYVVQVGIHTRRDPFSTEAKTPLVSTHNDFLLCEGLVWKRVNPWEGGDVDVRVRDTIRSAALDCNAYMDFVATEINRRGECKGENYGAKVEKCAIYKWDCVRNRAIECLYQTLDGVMFAFNDNGDIIGDQKYRQFVNN